MSSIEPVKVPKWGLSMEEGAIIEWRVAEGDSVAEGDELVDIETTKITNVCEAHKAGVIRRIVAQPGQTLPVGALIAVMADEEVPEGDIDAFVRQFKEQFDAEEAAGETGLRIELTDVGGGRKLRVGVAGEAQDAAPFVLLHGLGGDLENWSLVQEALAASRPAYAIELPGHGQSTKDVRRGGLDDLAADVIAAADEIGLARFLIAGHSLGGAVAARIALQYGDRIAGLGLVAPAAAPGGSLSTDYIEGFIAARRARDLRASVEMLFDDPAMATRDMLDGLVKAKRLDGAEAALTRLKENLYGGDPEFVRLAGSLREISAPVALIAAKGDRIVGAPDPAQFPEGADIRWLEGASHMPHLEAADAVGEALLDLAARSEAS